MKLIAKSRNGNMFLVGNDKKTAKWYFITDAVKKFAENFKRGIEVNIKTEKKNGKEWITYITTNVNNKPTTQLTKPIKVEQPKEKPVSSKPDYNKFNNYQREKTPQERVEIKAEAIGHMVSRTTISLQGYINPDNMEELISKLFDIYVNKVNEVKERELS